MKNDWNGILKILEIQHLSKEGAVLWEDQNIYNILHTTGEEYILSALFAGESVPTNYYFGLDDRSSLLAADTMSDLTGEPSINGYQRAAAASSGLFAVTEVGGVNQATGPIVSFTASGGSWGPVENVFLATTIDDTGYLIASAALSSSITVSDGQVVNVRMGLSLQDCATC